MKVLSVVGARPQFVKAFPVSETLAADHEEVLVHTGQHYDEELSDVFFEELGLPEPDYNLGVGSASHGEQTARILSGLEPVVAEESPDVVLVYGDTNSTLAGALVGSKSSATLAHVEAGLRSHNWDMPEEPNRVLTDHASDLLFAPTERAVDTLRAEGLGDRTYETGDVMYDALLAVTDRTDPRVDLTGDIDLDIDADEFVLATVHRAGNTDDRARLSAIIAALASAPVPVVFPVHPRTREALESSGLWEVASDELVMTDPVGYLEFVRLVGSATTVVTDSGGVQKEAFYLDTPCVTVRDETEWVETVECGWNTLVGADAAAIGRAIREHEPPASKPALYGAGDAAGRIVDLLEAADGREVADAPRP